MPTHLAHGSHRDGNMSFNRSLLFSFFMTASVLGCHHDRDASIPSVPSTGTTGATATEPGSSGDPNASGASAGDQNTTGTTEQPGTTSAGNRAGGSPTTDSVGNDFRGGAAGPSARTAPGNNGSRTTGLSYESSNTPAGGRGTPMSGGQTVDPSDPNNPTGMAADAGVGGARDGGMTLDAGGQDGGAGGTGRTRGSGGMGSGSAGSGGVGSGS
jgi:hypothetical protein